MDKACQVIQAVANAPNMHFLICEVMLFLMAFLFLIVAFSSAITALHHSLYEFTSVDKGMETLLEITLGSLTGVEACQGNCPERPQVDLSRRVQKEHDN